MQRTVLTCRKCGAALSLPVVLYTEEDRGKPELTDNTDAIECGYAFKSTNAYRRSVKGRPDPLEFTPQVWMTARDLLPVVTLTTDTKRLGGCCGLDGGGGPNRLCPCGNEVGTEMSDCWTSRLFIPEPKNTKWVAALP